MLKSAAHASNLHDERNRSASDGLGCSTSEDGGRHVENCLKDVFVFCVVCKLKRLEMQSNSISSLEDIILGIYD